MKEVTQRVIAGDQSERYSRGDEISDEEFPPGKLSDADVREHSRHHYYGGLEEDCGEDYSEHYGRLLHRRVERADDRESICEAQRKVDESKPSDSTKEIKRVKGLTLGVVESGYPQPRRHAKYQPELNALSRGVVFPRRVTDRGAMSRDYVYALHDIMISDSAHTLTMATSYYHIGAAYHDLTTMTARMV